LMVLLLMESAKLAAWSAKAQKTKLPNLAT